MDGLQSAINTIRNWKARRVAFGKPMSRELVVARIRDLWPEVVDEDIERIVEGAMK